MDSERVSNLVKVSQQMNYVARNRDSNSKALNFLKILCDAYFYKLY